MTIPEVTNCKEPAKAPIHLVFGLKPCPFLLRLFRMFKRLVSGFKLLHKIQSLT